MKAIVLLASVLVGSSLLINSIPENKSNTQVTATSLDELNSFTNVKKVYLSSKALEDVPMALKNHKSVEKLVLSDNYLTTLPEFIQSFHDLTYLDLSRNPDIDLDQSLEQIKDLKINNLNLSECNLVYVPFKIGEMKSLRSLDLSNNFIVDLPFYLGKLKNLEILNLSGNQITSLDYGIWKCKNLKHIDLSNIKGLNMNNICMNLQTLDHLQSVSLSYLNDTLPDEFGLINTRQWSIDNSTLTTLPDNLSNNETIEEISFESCESTEFDKIAPTLSTIANLQKLRISNSLTNVPSELKKIQQIESLDLSHNHLTTLPLSENDFPNITELVLYGNNFSDEEWVRIQKAFPNCNLVSDNIPKALNQPSIENQNSSIIPPFSQAILPVNEQQINSTQENSLVFENTTIKIPENAFVDVNGNLITGPVTISYTQYNDPLDIFLSGIPMKYDSAGISTYFQSAGMFDIGATANGQEVFLADGKNIELDFATNSKEDDYNFYSLDEQTGVWTNQGGTTLDTTNLGDFLSPFVGPYGLLPRKPILALPEMGVAIVKNKGRHMFKITEKHQYGTDSEQLNYPKTLIGKKHYLVPLYESDARKIKKQLKNLYHHKSDHYNTKVVIDVQFTPNKENDYFTLAIMHPDTLLEIPMKLNYYGNNFEKEQKYYKSFWKKYMKSVDKEASNNSDKIAAYEAKLAKYEAALKDYEDLQRDYLKNQKFEMAARTLVITQLGVWNCDRIPRMDEPEALAINFKGIGDSDFNPKAVTILDYTDVGTMYFLAKDITIESRNKIGVMAFDGDKCAFISSKDFYELRKNSNSSTLTAEVEVLNANELTVESIKSMMN